MIPPNSNLSVLTEYSIPLDPYKIKNLYRNDKGLLTSGGNCRYLGELDRTFFTLIL